MKLTDCSAELGGEAKRFAGGGNFKLLTFGEIHHGVSVIRKWDGEKRRWTAAMLRAAIARTGAGQQIEGACLTGQNGHPQTA